MPHLIRIAYTPIPREDPKLKEIKEIFLPLVDVFLIGNHRVGRSIPALIDSGSDFNIFPARYAAVYFSMSEKSIKRGTHLEIGGIGQSRIDAYKHLVTLQHLQFSIKTSVYFSFDHDDNLPILGRSGFFNHFKRITFHQNEKVVELELK